MEDAALLFDGVGESADAVAAAADHDHFGADLMGDMDMGGGEDGLVAVVLERSRRLECNKYTIHHK